MMDKPGMEPAELESLIAIGREAVRLVETWDTKPHESILQIKAWGRVQNLVRAHKAQFTARGMWGVHLRGVTTQDSGWLDERRGSEEEAMQWAEAAGGVYEARCDAKG